MIRNTKYLKGDFRGVPHFQITVKVQQSRYRPAVAQRVPGS